MPGRHAIDNTVRAAHRPGGSLVRARSPEGSTESGLRLIQARKLHKYGVSTTGTRTRGAHIRWIA